MVRGPDLMSSLQRSLPVPYGYGLRGSIGLLAQLVVSADWSYRLPSFPYFLPIVPNSLPFLIPNSQFLIPDSLLRISSLASALVLFLLWVYYVQGFHVSLISTFGVGAGILWIYWKILSRLLVREYHGVYFLRRCNLNRQQS